MDPISELLSEDVGETGGNSWRVLGVGGRVCRRSRGLGLLLAGDWLCGVEVASGVEVMKDGLRGDRTSRMVDWCWNRGLVPCKDGSQSRDNSKKWKGLG
jgi:hypothetical protein